MPDKIDEKIDEISEKFRRGGGIFNPKIHVASLLITGNWNGTEHYLLKLLVLTISKMYWFAINSILSSLNRQDKEYFSQRPNYRWLPQEESKAHKKQQRENLRR